MGGSDSEESTSTAGDTGDAGLIPGWRRSRGEGNGNHSSILAWRIPSIGSQRIQHDWASNTNTVLLLNCKRFFTFWINVLSQIDVVQIFSPILYLKSNKIAFLRYDWSSIHWTFKMYMTDWHLQAAVKPSPQLKLNIYVLPCLLHPFIHLPSSCSPGNH